MSAKCTDMTSRQIINRTNLVGIHDGSRGKRKDQSRPRGGGLSSVVIGICSNDLAEGETRGCGAFWERPEQSKIRSCSAGEEWNPRPFRGGNISIVAAFLNRWRMVTRAFDKPTTGGGPALTQISFFYS